MTMRDKVRLVAINVVPAAVLVTMLVTAKPMAAFDVRMVVVWAYLMGGMHGALVAWQACVAKFAKMRSDG